MNGGLYLLRETAPQVRNHEESKRRKNMIRTTFGRLSVTALCLVFMGSLCFGEVDEIVIDVSPNVLNLQSEGKVVTVHTDIAYSAVSASTVLLNGVEISSWKADDRGFFVAKFVMDTIKELDLAINEYNTLMLVGGTTIAGRSFIGEQEILAINVEPAGKK